jgi:bifunctional DNase/RNase
MSLCEVKVTNIFIDQDSGAPVVVLQDIETKNTLPILIAPLEASLIAIELEGKKPVRPLTHDLLINILKELSFEVKSVVIHDLKNNVYYASLNIISGDKSIEMDCRPSDALAIALRTKSTIYVKKKVFALAMGLENAAHSSDGDTLKEVLEDIEIDEAGGKIM